MNYELPKNYRKERGYKAGDFSYNTGSLRCPTCDGTGVISLDVQFLPDVEIPCPDCGGSRYGKDASRIRRIPKKGGQTNTLPFGRRSPTLEIGQRNGKGSVGFDICF